MKGVESSLRNWSIDITIRPHLVASERFIEATLLQALSSLSSAHIASSVTEISVLITDDDEMRDLNAHYRGKDSTTDVLSFSLLEGEDETALASEISCLGDIVISLDTAKRQSEAEGTILSEELARLLVHGLLHLFGYDHENVSQERANEMFSLQDRIMDSLQIDEVESE